MRLRKLVLHGFKSFADRTEFLFDQPITCIVGPNGCGKSNVVDAVKWVLGEQSAKSLRGDAMLDVVFNGSGNRKAAGMAEVILGFENLPDADGKRILNLPLDEVNVGRRLYRDGTSEYTINNKSARLKDIKDLFLDTGVGVDAYSVIEQGRVSQLLESNPLQRRIIFEEAAGISRFKVKKKEAQRKLEKVDQNLLRVNDVTQEIDRRLRGVKIAAGKARNYQELSVRLNELRLGYSLQEYHKLHGELTRVGRETEETRFRVDDVAGDLAKRQNELAAAREQADASAQTKQRAEHELVEAGAAVRAAQQKQQFAERQIQQLAEQAEQMERDVSVATERQKSADEQFGSESANLEQLTAALEAKRAEIDAKQQAYKDDQLKLNTLATDIERNKRTVMDLMRRSGQLDSRLASIGIERKNIAQQQERQDVRRAAVAADTKTAEDRASELATAVEGVLAQLTDKQAEQEAHKQNSLALGQRIKQITEQNGSAKEQRSGLLSRQKLLQDLETRREGVSDAVKKILRERDQKFPFVRGLVADLLRVDVEHATVIEAALDGRDQWLVVDSLESVPAEALPALSGRVCFLSREDDRGHGHLSGHALAGPFAVDWSDIKIGLRLAADLVKVDTEHRPAADSLLGRTAVVDTLADAIELHRVGPAEWRYVTKQGHVVEPDGAIKAGPFSAGMGLLSRRSELDAIVQQIAEVDRTIAGFTAELSQSSQQARQVEETINQVRNAVYQLNTKKVELTSQQQQTRDRLASLGRELPLLDRELANLLAQTGKLAEEETTAAAQKAELDAQQAQLQQQIEQATQQHKQLVEASRHLGEELTLCRVALGQVQEKQLASRQTVERLKAQRQEAAQQIERLSKSAAGLGDRQEAARAEAQKAAHDEQTHQQRVAELKERVADLTTQLQEQLESVRSLSAKVESIRGLHGELETKRHQLQIQQSELSVRREGLVGRTQDELQINLAERYTDIVAEYKGERPGSAIVTAEDRGPFPYDAGSTDWDEVAREIKDLKEKIGRLGNVNLDAIGELDELEGRQTFYAGQLDDLRQAKAELEKLIDEINAESGIRFEQTFNAVREHFKELFRQLFGGGSADIFLELEVEDREAMRARGPSEDGSPRPVLRKTVDPLDAGIEIIARPPGKKPVSITQLSGGEKAMTCIALLMGIFKSKPSPFCILDEVDAPLDEANNVRFGQIVQAFTSLSQFIVITHHKRTMQIGDLLYGVTQQEQGVSRRVAVKFDQVAQGGRISEAAINDADQREEVEADVEVGV